MQIDVNINDDLVLDLSMRRCEEVPLAVDPRIQMATEDMTYWSDGRHNITKVLQKVIDYFAWVKDAQLFAEGVRMQVMRTATTTR